MTQTIEQKLDMLAEYNAQRDLLELNKRALLDEVKIPAEIEQIVSAGMKETEQADNEYNTAIVLFAEQIEKRVASVVIPQEYKDALAELDRQRAEITAKMGEVEAEKRTIKSEYDEYKNRQTAFNNTRKNEIRAKIDRQTHDVYANIANRKNEIEAEFSGKAEDVNENIKKLEAEIKAEVKAHGASVKGKFFHAVYVRGRVTWNTDKMDAWVIDHPFLKEARKEGEPSITLRKV
jgi:hypothetical protein